ncbi:MAG: PKD domain-containing protein [Candidatus Bipolaricaulota bacterium]|nr:MAG: PKD domain-containing protein [Candidatus Bipolaricaulota bacterium]
MRQGPLVPVAMALALLLWVTSSASPQEASNEAVLYPSIHVAPGTRISLGTPIALDASASTHRVVVERIDEVRYTWDLGDGNVRSGQQVVHDFARPGTYHVVLTMEVFEKTGIFHRSTSETDLVVALSATPELVAIIDLESGHAQMGRYAALVRIEDELVLLERHDKTMSRAERWQSRLPIDLQRWVVAGGLLAVGDLHVWMGSLAFELAGDRLLASFCVGLGSGTTVVHLTDWLPTAAQTEHDLSARIHRADIVSAGLCYELAPHLYLLGALGMLHAEGAYGGSGRVTIDGERLPTTFEHRAPVLCLGLGVRLSWVMLSLQAMVIL